MSTVDPGERRAVATATSARNMRRVSAMAARCEGNKIEILDRVVLPDSLGFFYTAMCQFIGFAEFGEEYKVMGLAPYGDDNHRDLMAKLVHPTENGLFKLGRGYIGMHSGGESGELDERSHLSRLCDEQRQMLVAERRAHAARGLGAAPKGLPSRAIHRTMKSRLSP